MVSPWDVISTDLNSFYVYAGRSAGQGLPIGYIRTVNGRLFFDMLAPYELDLQNNIITLFPPMSEIKVVVNTCPDVVARMGEMTCKSYVALNNTLVMIDFSSLGEVAPKIPGELITAQNIIQLVRSARSFESDLDSVRDEFLIPLLMAIGDFRRMPEFKESLAHDVYIDKMAETHAKLIFTALDSILKINKMAPQTLQEIAPDLGLVIAVNYLTGGDEHSNRAGSVILSKNQPRWFQETIAPILLETSYALLDIFLNGSQTPRICIWPLWKNYVRPQDYHPEICVQRP